MEQERRIVPLLRRTRRRHPPFRLLQHRVPYEGIEPFGVLSEAETHASGLARERRA